MNKIAFYLILFIISGSAVSAPKKSFDTSQLEPSTQSIMVLTGNIMQMLPGLSKSEDWDHLMSIQTTSGETIDALYFFVDLGSLYKNMVNSTDKQMVKLMIEKNKKTFQKKCSLLLKNSNLQLPYIRNPAALNEATKLRDAISEACTIVEGWD